MGAESSKELNIGTEVSFLLEGKLHTVKSSDDITPDTSLNSYLRNHVGLRGTKGMCYEGGCGACLAVVTIQHPITKKNRKFAINSCLISILSCHGWTIDTIDGIGNKQKGYNEVQETLAKFNGTQCGFCSPGMVMNMYALSAANENLTMKEVENSFGGNLCRCTGYRPILDAFKSMTMDADPRLKELYSVDIEDIKICKRSGEECTGSCNLQIIEEKSIMMTLNENKIWYKVHSIEEILQLFNIIGHKTYRFVGGNTEKGVFPIMNKPDIWIDILSVPELVEHKLKDNLILGANVSLTDAMSIINNVADEKPEFFYLKKVYDHLDLVANVPVRNVGTLAGNLSLKHEHHEFPSDVFLLLETIKAQVEIVERHGNTQTKSLVDYLNFDMTKCILKSIIIPPLDPKTFLFQSYKICPRVQNAHAYVNAGFLIEHDNFKVKSARILFGGIDPNFTHARKTEKYLIGKKLTDNSTLEGALDKLNEELNPNYILPDATPKFRKDLAIALFYKFILSAVPKNKINSRNVSGGDRLQRGLSSGSQMYDSNKNLYPLTQPIQKLEALKQCAGEAQYINDMPAIVGEAFAAFVIAEAKPFSKIREINLSKAKSVPGYITYLDHKAIPGVNYFTSHQETPTKEQLFAEERVLYNGQPIGIVIASSEEQAITAARSVKIIFEHSNEKPSFTVADVIKNKQTSRIENAQKIEPKNKGGHTKKVIKGHLELGPQYHFTMETQTSICIPNDEDGLDIYSSTQFMDHVQQAVSKVINIPMNKINVIVKRVGGAYGGKVIRASMVACACAVAAYKLNRPVRFILPLIENMKCIGKRIGATVNYEVGVDNNGLIQYMKTLMYEPTGLSFHNEQVTMVIPPALMETYKSDTWELNVNIVQTDMPGNAYCRAPGSTEAIATIESIMDHIAYVLNKDPVEVRKINISEASDKLSELMEEVLEWSEYNKRRKQIDDFNSKNRWMKKGISLVLMNFHLHLLYPFSTFVTIYAKDGTVAVSTGGIEMGQGINTKVAQVCAHFLSISLDFVQIKAANSLVSPNNLYSVSSLTSECVCYATMKACQEIMKRLKPIKEKMKNAKWQEIIKEANKENINLTASYMVSPEAQLKDYYIPGVCVAEVSCDILTGEHVIDKVNFIEDAGQSMSPLVDVGQMEGAFVMGLGYFLTENLVYNDEGKLLTHRTCNYNIPGVKDIPVDFEIKFKQNSSNPNGVLNSKATAEASLCLSVSVPLAIRQALSSARTDADHNADRFVPMNGPTTVEYKFLNSLNNYKDYKL